MLFEKGFSLCYYIISNISHRRSCPVYFVLSYPCSCEQLNESLFVTQDSQFLTCDYSREAIILIISLKGADYLREAINQGTDII